MQTAFRSVLPVKHGVTFVTVALGRHAKTGEPQWQARQMVENKQMLLVLDNKSELTPRHDGQIFEAQYAIELFVGKHQEIHTMYLLKEVAEMPAEPIVPEIPVADRIKAVLNPRPSKRNKVRRYVMPGEKRTEPKQEKQKKGKKQKA